jgi:hypothetical protein
MSTEVEATIAAFKLLREPTPLASYLHIYNATSRLCYLDYMTGATLLAQYLAPIYIPPASYTIPRMLRNYELYELAKILIRYSSNPLTYQQAEDSIYEYYTLQH